MSGRSCPGPGPDPSGRRLSVRSLLDKAFTFLAVLSVLIIAGGLALVVAPMLWRGAGAVFFYGTSEFRRLQLEQFNRGDARAVEAESAAVSAARQPLYDLLDRFRRGVDTAILTEEARSIYRELGKQLEHRGADAGERAAIRATARQVRDALEAAFQATDKAAALRHLDQADALAADARLKGTVAADFAVLARDYRHVVETVDLSHRAEYAQALAVVDESIRRLFGPRPNEPRPALVMDQYGATRWDVAQKELGRLLVAESWVQTEPGKPLIRIQRPREEQFAGTDLAPLFPLIRTHAEEMLRPRFTFYWQYFIDAGLCGRYFGGIAAEILGTLLVTLVAMLVAVPLGIISAAYLVECAGENLAVRVIRTCINTLAGVPSIVFGLFGLAFFVIFLLPRLGLPQGSSALAGGLTLGLLVLPVVIRASEEAIRAVPPAYKEAALALGAGRLRCFLTVILPAAMPGILTGIILSVSRAAGETAPVLFTAAVAIGPTPWPPWSAITRPVPTLSYASYHMAVGDRLAAMVPHNQYGMVMTLVALVLGLNAAALALRWHISRRLRGH